MKYPKTLSFLILVAILFATFGGPEKYIETRGLTAMPSGARPSRSLRVTGVSLQSVGDSGAIIDAQAQTMNWRKRNLGFFSVAFLWELTLHDGRIHVELDSTQREPLADDEPCGLRAALRETVNLFNEFSGATTTIRVEPFLLEIADHGRLLFKIQSATGKLHKYHGIEFRSNVEVSSASGKLLRAARMILHPDGFLIVKGGYVISEVDRASVHRKENAVFRLLAGGRIEARHSSAAEAIPEAVKGQALTDR